MLFKRLKINTTLAETILIDKISDYTGHNAAIYGLSQASGDDYFYSVGGEGWIVKWPVTGPVMDGVIVGDTGGKLFSIATVGENHLLIAGDIHGDLFWIDTNNKEILGRSAFHKGSVFDICVINTSQLVTVSGDGYICLWDIGQRLPLLSKRLSNQGLRCVVHDAENGNLFVGASDNNVYVLDALSFEQKHIIQHAHENSIFALNFITDIGLISGGRDAHLKIWDLIDYTAKSDLPAHWYTINKILYIPEFNLIVTASRDKTIRLWDDENNELIRTLDVQKGGHFNSVNTLIWNNEHQILLSAGDDRVIRKWKIQRKDN
jgi:WD40 repeat protein